MAASAPQKIDVPRLQQLCNDDPVAKAFMSSIASRTNNSAATTVDRAQRVLADEERGDFPRHEIVACFKQLEEIGVGRFVIGRRGQPSRFEWSASMVDVGKAALGSSDSVVPKAPLMNDVAPDDEPPLSSPKISKLTFPLRRDYQLTFDLPSDLSEREAERLANFIRTLPLST